MTGYREHSFDPNAGGGGRPLRPFNWVQWTGVGFMAGAGVMLLAVVASAAGLLSPAFEHNAGLAAMMSVVGASLINSRREGSTDLAPELAPARRKWLLITIVVCVAIIGAAVVIEFSGA
jgi:hypothetical protein